MSRHQTLPVSLGASSGQLGSDAESGSNCAGAGEWHAVRREDERIRDGGRTEGGEGFRARSVVPGCLPFILLTRTLVLSSFLSSLRFANQTSPINTNPGSVGVCVRVCACVSVVVDPDLLDFKNLPLLTPSQPVSSELQPSTSKTFICRRIPFSRRKRNCHHING